MFEYVGIIFTFLFTLGLAALLLFIPKLLSPSRPSDIKSMPFECGKEPFAISNGQFSIKFYLIAMLFILFDVEVIWFFPWAVTNGYWNIENLRAQPIASPSFVVIKLNISIFGGVCVISPIPKLLFSRRRRTLIRERR